MLPHINLAQVSECHGDTNRAMPAHAEIAGIVEEDDSRDTTRILRLAQERSHDCFVTTWLVNQHPPVVIGRFTKPNHALAKGTCAEIRTARDDDSRRLALGVRVDDVNLSQSSTHSAAPAQLLHQALKRVHCCV